MKLDSETLARLREELLHRGARASTPPGPGADVKAEPTQAEVLAVMQRVAPLCEVLYLLMVADESSHGHELSVLRGAIRALTDGVLRTSAIDILLASFRSALAAHGRETRLIQVAGQLAADRHDAEAAYMLAAVMVIADESTHEHERELLAELRELLGISYTRAQELLGEARESMV